MRTLFISDLHLADDCPAAVAQFESFLRAEAHTARALYILGDLFEVWIGDDDPQAVNARVCTALRRLADTGVACFVMRGNRDFLLGEDFARRSGCRLLEDPCIVELDGRRVLLTHGDALCTGDTAYQRLRANVRRPAWQRRALALPLATRQLLAAGARAGSRAHTRATAEYIMDVSPPTVAAAMRACQVDLLVHGHTHRPAVHAPALADGTGTRIVLGAWHQSGSVLRWQDGAYELAELPRTGGPAGGPE